MFDENDLRTGPRRLDGGNRAGGASANHNHVGLLRDIAWHAVGPGHQGMDRQRSGRCRSRLQKVAPFHIEFPSLR